MFEDQNNNPNQQAAAGHGQVEDIFSDTDKTRPQTQPRAGAPVSNLGPPSALTQGKLHPAGSNTAPMSSQMSGQGRPSHPFGKWLIIVVVFIIVVGGSVAAYFQWQNRSAGNGSGSSPNTPVDNQGSGNIQDNSGLGGAAGNLQDKIEESVLDPFGAPAGADGQDAGAQPEQNQSAVDTDQDGLIDSQEIEYGTNPALFDSDSDGLSDWEEIAIFGTDPLNMDTDSDGFKDGEEVQNGYNPKGPGKLLDFDSARDAVK